MRKIIKRLFQSVLLLILFALLLYWRLIAYGWGQLMGQLHIINNAVPITGYIESNPDDTTAVPALKLLQEIRTFAMDSLGLHKSDNYTTFFDQQNQPVLWVVTGCKPFAMEPKTWDFPLIGTVSYKGFFREQKAIAEARKIVLDGFESEIYSPSAWSTLGWFKDPVLSGMLRRSPGQLAELIIHELTHATVYKSSSVEENENLATFIGEQGAILFLISKYGLHSAMHQQYLEQLHDDRIYANHMVKGCQMLDSLYSTFQLTDPVVLKAASKFQLIAQILTDINYLQLYNKEKYRFDFRKKPLPGNPYFMGYKTYHEDQSELQGKLIQHYNGSLKQMISDLHND